MQLLLITIGLELSPEYWNQALYFAHLANERRVRPCAIWARLKMTSGIV